MTKLENLIYALTAVLICYHDNQSGVKQIITESDDDIRTIKSMAYAVKVIQEKPDFQVYLDKLIKECTKDNLLRRPLLHFILHEIVYLKSLQDRTASFDLLQLEEYKDQMTQLLVDLKELLALPKSSTYKVSYSKIQNSAEKSIALSGLKNDGIYGNDLCKSGELLKKMVLGPLYISIHSTKMEVREIAEAICMEHQNSLLIPELSTQNLSQKQQIGEQQQTVDRLSTEHHESQKKQEAIIKKQNLMIYLLFFLFKRSQNKAEKKPALTEPQSLVTAATTEETDEEQPVSSMTSLFGFGRFYGSS